jgi:hypothetical protein
VFGNAGLGSCDQLIAFPAGFCNPDNGYVEPTRPDHRLKRRKYFLIGKIAACSEKNQSVGLFLVHGSASIVFLAN